MKKVFIAITTYEDKLYAQCFKSIQNNLKSLQNAGIYYEVHYVSELYIDLARNKLVNTFLKTECTDLLFIDADLGFQNNAIVKILGFDRDFVAGAYRVKHQQEVYPVVVDWSHNNNCKESETGLVYVISAPTGFMKLSRRVFDECKRHYKLKPDNNGTIHFFDTGMKVFEDGKWWGEDASFCHKWRNIGKGYECYVDPDIDFVHVGNQEFSSNFEKYIQTTQLNKIGEVNDGFMPDYDMKVLQHLAKNCQDVVEVGCWKGETTKMLLENVKGKVHVVDHFKGNDSDVTKIHIAVNDNIKEQFLRKVGSFDNLVMHEGESVEIASKLNGEKFDMVFIDANHDYKSVKADIEAWLPRCKKILSGHDYSARWGEVIRAVQELGDTHHIKVKGSVWWTEL